jgi:DNA-binding transcriptional ArsR family regulator
MSKADRAAAGVFSALGNETRLTLVRRLGKEPLSATALAQRSAVTRQAITKHLQVLEASGLVTHRKSGREVLYAVEPRKLHQARAFLDAVSASWDQAIDRLRLLVEESTPPTTRRRE